MSFNVSVCTINKEIDEKTYGVLKASNIQTLIIYQILTLDLKILKIFLTSNKITEK